jgi:hypothetical protein
MIDTTLSGLQWAQEHFPAVAYINAVWDSRYPEFANGNEPKPKGKWPFAPVMPSAEETNVTPIKKAKKA